MFWSVEVTIDVILGAEKKDKKVDGLKVGMEVGSVVGVNDGDDVG